MSKKHLIFIGVLILSIAKFSWASNPIISQNNLKVFIAISDSPKYIEDWVSKRANEPVTINRKQAFSPDETIYIAFIASGFGTDNNLKVNLHANINITDPNGEKLFDLKDYSKAIGSVPDRKPSFMMLDPALDLVLENIDPKGVYILHIEIIDKTLNKISMATENIYLVSSVKLKNILNKPINNSKILDELWMYFFETNNPMLILRIISVLHWVEDGHGLQIAFGGAARRSLLSNAFQHPEVYNICINQLNRESGLTAKILAEIIEEVDKKKMPNY